MFKHLILITVSALLCAAQSVSSSISGIVRDPSGLVVPGVTLKLINSETGVETKGESLESGVFRFAPLDPGSYSLQATKAGFKSIAMSRLIVGVASIVRLDLSLSLGETLSTVAVTSDPPLLQTAESSVGGTLTAAELTRLPVNGRNYTTLVQLMPGTSNRSASQEVGGFSGTGMFSVNGQRTQDNNYTLNGVENNVYAKNSPGASAPMDSIQEMRIMTGASAEFGRSAGANVNMVIKSGGQDLHGSLYEYFRNDRLDANDFFANRQGRGKVPYRQNQYGLAIGGPLYLPKLYPHRNRTFWFVSWEGFRARRGTTQISTVPTLAERNGDFSATGRSIFDPLTGTSTATGISRSQFPNNQVPASRISRASKYILDELVPVPNIAGVNVNNLLNTAPFSNDRDALVTRWDHHFERMGSLSAHFLWQAVASLEPLANSNYLRESNFPARSGSIAWNKGFGATTLLETRFGYSDPFIPIVNRHNRIGREEFLRQSGITLFQDQTLEGVLPSVNSSGDFSLPTGAAIYGDRTLQYFGTLTKIVGKQQWKAGVQYSRRHYLYDGSNPVHGALTFDQRLTNSAGFPNSGKSNASFLLGLPSSINRAEGDALTNARQNVTHLFAQNDWRVNARLQITFGLRYEIQNAPYERNNLIAGFDLLRNSSTGQYSADLLWASTNPLPNPITGVRNSPPNQSRFGRNLQVEDWNNIAPRVGVSWVPTGRTVLRAGYGVFFNSTFMQEIQDKRKFYPYNVVQFVTTNTSSVPDLTLNSSGPAFANTAPIGGWPQDPNNRTPYSQQWNFFIEHQLPSETVISVGYVGSTNKRQVGYAPFNVALTPGPGAVQPRRLLPVMGDVFWGRNDYNSNYNALQVKGMRRFRNGLGFQANYTWSRSMDEQSSLAEWKVQNPFNRRGDYSRSSWDLRHVFQFSYLYELPFGRGRRFGAEWRGPIQGMLGGWALEGITRMQTGAPINIVLGQDRANVGNTVQRPDVTRNPYTGTRDIDAWFDTRAFQLPPAFTYGSAGAFIVDSDGRRSWDLAIAKSLPLYERLRMEIRGEAFNLPNRVSFGDPVANFSAAQFGRVTSATAARQVQIALRLRF